MRLDRPPPATLTTESCNVAPRCLRHRPVTRGVGSRRQECRASAARMLGVGGCRVGPPRRRLSTVEGAPRRAGALPLCASQGIDPPPSILPHGRHKRNRIDPCALVIMPTCLAFSRLQAARSGQGDKARWGKSAGRTERGARARDKTGRKENGQGCLPCP
jgi:hypothetical protein